MTFPDRLMLLIEIADVLGLSDDEFVNGLIEVLETHKSAHSAHE